MREQLDGTRYHTIFAALVAATLSTACVDDTDATVGEAVEPLYRGTLYSLSPGERRAFRLPDGSSIEYEVVTGGEFRPVPVDSCDQPFCQSWDDIGNVDAWMNQWAFMFMKLRIRNRSPSAIHSRYKSLVHCVYASGNPLPAPWRTFGDEHHDGNVGTRAAETIEVDVGCMEYGAGSTFDAAWPIDGSVDVSVHDNEVADPFDAPMDPLDGPWD
jgi:hypothetical protein